MSYSYIQPVGRTTIELQPPFVVVSIEQVQEWQEHIRTAEAAFKHAQEYGEARNQAANEWYENSKELETKLGDALKNNAVLDERIKELIEQLCDVRNEHSAALAKIRGLEASLQRQIEIAGGWLKARDQVKSDWTKEVVGLQQEIDSLKRTNDNFAATCNAHLKARAEAINTANQLRNELDVLNITCNQLKRDRDLAEGELDKAREALEDADEALKLYKTIQVIRERRSYDIWVRPTQYEGDDYAYCRVYPDHEYYITSVNILREGLEELMAEPRA